MKKLFLSFLLFIVGLSTWAESNGTCGDNLSWTLSDDGVLTITGTGAMKSECGEAWGLYSSDALKAVKQVILPEGLTTIDNHAFWGFTGLTSINIPNSVESIGNNAFAMCGSLTTITFGSSSSLKSIGDDAFSDCVKLSSVTIPNSVTNLGTGVFCDCSALTSVTIGNGVTTIPTSAFAGCSNLTTVNLPSSIQTIGDDAFDSCSSLTSFVIPSNVTSIGDYAFMDCSGLTSITCLAITPPTYGSVSRHVLTIPVYVQESALSSYKSANTWKDFSTIGYINKALVDGETYDGSEEVQVQTLTYSRTFNNTSWQALYVPFAMSYSDWEDEFEVAYINGIRQQDTDGDGVIDYQVMDVVKVMNGTLKPNTPYLIKAKTTGEKTKTFKDAALSAATSNSIDCSTTVAKYTFTGTYETIPAATMQSNGYYGMGGGSLVISTNDLKPFRWYMGIESRDPLVTVSGDAKANIYINVIGEEDETDGITTLTSEYNDKDEIYDLTGRRVSNSYKGLIIKNGKKYINK